MSENDDRIKALRVQLSTMVTDWGIDGSIPPKYIRKNGLGDQVAIVDPWGGGYQSPHHPLTIGWRATQPRGTRSYSSVLLVSDFANKDEAIEKAKRKADQALVELGLIPKAPDVPDAEVFDDPVFQSKGQ